MTGVIPPEGPIRKVDLTALVNVLNVDFSTEDEDVQAAASDAYRSLTILYHTVEAEVSIRKEATLFDRADKQRVLFEQHRDRLAELEREVLP